MKDKKLAQYLLSVKAIELRPQNPFTWASGIKSPIYCDNRQLLSYPEIRNYLKNLFAKNINSKYPDVQAIVGVATGAIAIGALVADFLNLPFLYVRAKAKEHGRENLIEGKIIENSKIVVIEDLISTGGSSLSAIDALKNAKLNVLGLLAIFSYGFKIAEDNFTKAQVSFETLTDFETLLVTASKENYISDEEIKIVKEWQGNFAN